MLGAQDVGDGDDAPDGGADEDKDVVAKREKEKLVQPVMRLKAKVDGASTDVQMMLASFACNLMVEPIQVSFDGVVNERAHMNRYCRTNLY